MALKFITPDVFREMLSNAPEWMMGFHLLRRGEYDYDAIAVAGTILIDLDEEVIANATQLARQVWLNPEGANPFELQNDLSSQVAAFEEWCGSLSIAGYEEVRPLNADIGTRFILNPYDPAQTPRGPAPTTTVHGHLPFNGTTRAETVMYRAEPFPTSRYIDPQTGYVSGHGGLYGFPPSEVPFVPTGFSAVGRYALPNVAPSNYRWQLRIPAGTPFRAGASVPLYGQAGGGVEVCIDADFQNVGHIANPIVLPSL
ncbi:hypothetical protein LA6_004967 [Marinibacterium anthonyi]|nr:hypothetical protein LA6_004967 [Marinibacterium anthonyi]